MKLRVEKVSPSSKNAKIDPKTGSRAKNKAVSEAVIHCCANVCNKMTMTVATKLK